MGFPMQLHFLNIRIAVLHHFVTFHFATWTVPHNLACQVEAETTGIWPLLLRRSRLGQQAWLSKNPRETVLKQKSKDFHRG